MFAGALAGPGDAVQNHLVRVDSGGRETDAHQDAPGEIVARKDDLVLCGYTEGRTFDGTAAGCWLAPPLGGKSPEGVLPGKMGSTRYVASGSSPRTRPSPLALSANAT